MAYEERDNSGTLFRAKERRSDKSPEYEGKALIDGKRVYLSAWPKQGRDGKFFSIAFKPADAPKQQRAERPRQDRDDPRTSYGTTLDDDLPF